MTWSAKRQPAERKKLSANHLSDEGSQIDEKLLQLKKKKKKTTTSNLIQKWAKNLNFGKEGIQMASKDVKISPLLREMQNLHYNETLPPPP